MKVLIYEFENEKNRAEFFCLHGGAYVLITNKINGKERCLNVVACDNFSDTAFESADKTFHKFCKLLG